MSATNTGRSGGNPRLVHFVIYGVVAGLIVMGCGGLFSVAVFGSSNPTNHWLSLAVIAVLAVAAGLSANGVLTWLMARHPQDATQGRNPKSRFLALLSPASNREPGNAQRGAGSSEDHVKVSKGSHPYNRANSPSKAEY